MPENITGTTGFTKGAIQKPSSKDSGSTVFNTLETFMTRLATHTHDGADSEIISRTVSKTEYTKAAATANWSSVDSTTGNKYLEVTITTVAHKANNGGAGSNPANATYSFWYYKDVIGSANSGPGWTQFHPEMEWTEHGIMKISTNISKKINDASSSPKIRIQAF